ncbi:hypothetical protein PHJA_002584700 [Phtheirospermum japonicum]|uniref:Uncharacterized protein n=1 Tax=Phtheirospermum japonicum TaxID=374723 RepID=A0A830CV23_9LAMI|nr:hypothetical protein PHJA_002584700 [Phtheirospermum japonicum]
MQREEHGKDPTMVDTFIITHMRKDGTYVHEKSKRIAADVESRISATKEAGEEADVTKIFVGAVDGLKKQCLYGTGSLKHKYVDLCSTSSSLATSHVESAALRTQVEQLTQQQYSVGKFYHRAIYQQIFSVVCDGVCDVDVSGSASLNDHYRDPCSRCRNQLND